MNIIYLSCSCSEKKFELLRSSRVTKKLPQAQKYHRLMMEGLVENIDGNISAISVFPVNRSWSRQNIFEREEENINGIRYIYCKFINIPILKQLSVITNAKREIRKIVSENTGKTVLVCDILNQSLSNAARYEGKKYNIPTLGIVTDVPGHTSGARRKTSSFIVRKVKYLAEKNGERNMLKYDSYLFLTEAMNDVVNKKCKPYVVIEGQSDISMMGTQNTLDLKMKPKVIMYAGGIHREFGIADLVQAFLEGHFIGWEMHIYGDGNYQSDLKKIAEENCNVKYFGVQPNKVIVDSQIKASLLVNPRLTDAEYVKYSFPSKTLECMVSGTPLLTTRLPGMPKEYYDYVYLLDKENKQDFRRVLSEILAFLPEELHSFGTRAKNFAINEKNNVKQAKKLLDFAKKLF